jgi:DNA uptake protein ComE-like DNA-binding protein
MRNRWIVAFLVALAATAGTAAAQVGKSQGVVDANTAPEKDLLAMPHMTPAIVKGLLEKRPFASITDLNGYLLGQKLTQEQAMAFYEKAFVHINLNTATPQEILLVPGAGKRMVREFDEYRPWKSYAQFDKEIGKYVGADGAAKLAVHVHPGPPQHRQRRRHPDDPQRRPTHGPRVQGVPALEDEGAVHQGDRQVRRREGRRADVALRGDRLIRRQPPVLQETGGTGDHKRITFGPR